MKLTLRGRGSDPISYVRWQGPKYLLRHYLSFGVYINKKLKLEQNCDLNENTNIS